MTVRKARPKALGKRELTCPSCGKFSMVPQRLTRRCALCGYTVSHPGAGKQLPLPTRAR